VYGDVQKILSRLVAQYYGDNVIEEGYLTSVHFSNLGKAVQFMSAFNKNLFDYKDNQCSYNLIIDEKAAILDVPSDNSINLNNYIEDVLDYGCQQEVVVNEIIKNNLTNTPYHFELLGNKVLRRSEQTVSLYKMSGFTE
jgi:hypothetical protein